LRKGFAKYGFTSGRTEHRNDIITSFDAGQSAVQPF
jgi:hypothetical protein